MWTPSASQRRAFRFFRLPASHTRALRWKLKRARAIILKPQKYAPGCHGIGFAVNCNARRMRFLTNSLYINKITLLSFIMSLLRRTTKNDFKVSNYHRLVVIVQFFHWCADERSRVKYDLNHRGKHILDETQREYKLGACIKKQQQNVLRRNVLLFAYVREKLMRNLARCHFIDDATVFICFAFLYDFFFKLLIWAIFNLVWNFKNEIYLKKKKNYPNSKSLHCTVRISPTKISTKLLYHPKI